MLKYLWSRAVAELLSVSNLCAFYSGLNYLSSVEHLDI